MLKARTYDPSATNIASLGSDLEKKIRLESSNHEASWANAGKTPGLEIWRIEKFHPVPIDPKMHGTFYSGDSYIVLHSHKGGNDLGWDVHFWLGAHTTQDEAGTAAYKTVELDDHLGGRPIQYREVQDYESPHFLSYFPKGLKILAGGMESGFHHVKPEAYKPRLLQLKGKRHVRVTEVPLSSKSLNSGDVFILDAGLSIFQWNGKDSSVSERAKGATVTHGIADERNGKAKIEVVDESKDDDAFFKLIGGKLGPIASAAEGGSDIDADSGSSSKVYVKQLYRLHEEGGKFTFKKIAEGDKFKRSDFDSTDPHVLDAGTEVIVWIGKASSALEKKNALHFAQQYLTQHKRPPHTPISRVLEGNESSTFKAIVQ